ncbi:MFS transporter [Klebsiella variicola]
MNLQSTTIDGFKSETLRATQGIIAAASFSLLLAGTNMTTPLITIYKNTLHFNPFLMSMTFVSYVSVLIGVLFIMTKPPFVSLSPYLLSSSLLIAGFADIMIGSSTKSGILLGRSMAGVAGGLGTGSAAALVVAAMGIKGRSISATGNLVGAVLGTSFTQWSISQFGNQSMHLVFHIHAILCCMFFVVLMLVLFCNKKTNEAILNSSISKENLVRVKSPLFTHTLYMMIGSVAWISLSVAIVYLPSFFDLLDMSIANKYSIITMLLLCAIGQLSSSWLTSHTPRSSGMLYLMLGCLLVMVSSILSYSIIAVIGCGFIGLGVGISYRLNLLILSKGASPTQQGTRSSFYAAITYGAAALTVLACGLVGNIVGLKAVVYFFLLITMSITAIFHIPSPKLKDSQE